MKEKKHGKIALKNAQISHSQFLVMKTTSNKQNHIK